MSIQGNQTGNNNIVLAPTSGNVGIGTTGPGAKLHVVTDGNGMRIERANGDSSGTALYLEIARGIVIILPMIIPGISSLLRQGRQCSHNIKRRQRRHRDDGTK